MAEIAKLKKQKNAYKLHLTVSINKLTLELNKEEKDRNVELLQQYIQQVEFKHEKWEKAMMEIQDQDESCDIDESMDKIDTTLDEVISLKVRTKECIESKVKVEKVDSHDKGTPVTEQPRKLQDKVHLPKLELKKFNGINIECFQEWYQIFIATIGKSNLDDVEKFVYLKGAVEEEAEKVIEGYPLTRENYELALGDLYDTYGDKEVVINHHVSKLLSLPNQADTSLRELYTKIVSHVRSLEALGITAQSYSVFLVPIVKSKLNEDLRKDLTKNKIKDIKALLVQLKEEVATEASSAQVKLAFEPDVPATLQKPQSKVNKPNYNWANNQQSYQPVYSSAQALQATANTKAKYCIFCPGMQSHWVEDCKRLATLPPNQVKDIAMNSNACLGCFKKGHYFRDCRARERLKCQKCQSPGHHTALHEDRTSGAYITVTDTEKPSRIDEGTKECVDKSLQSEHPECNETLVKGAQAVHAIQGREKIMPVMKARIVGNNGKRLEINVMLDPCSDQSFIRSDVVNELQLGGPKVPMNVSGIGGITNKMTNMKILDTKLYNRSFNQEIDVSGLAEMPTICKPIARPAVPAHILNGRDLRNLKLADDYHKDEEQEIHMLLGLDNYWYLVTGRNKVKKSTDQPVAMETLFGWVLVSNSYKQDIEPDINLHTMNTMLTIAAQPHKFEMKPATNLCTIPTSSEIESSLNDDLKKFWEIEQEIIEKPIKEENREAVDKFHKSVSYDPENKKYTVGLPFINDDKNLGSNYKVAEKRLQSLLKKFECNPDLKEKYTEAMNEYISAGFAEPVPEDEITSVEPGIYYIPHRAVIKEENTTTKTRIVSDASSSSKYEVCLNDKLLTGPKRQPSIVEILIRWRKNIIALVADIKKMYSMILVQQSDRNSLRFLWVENGKIKHYRHTVLAFGLRSAPYLAIETVQSHIQKFKDKYPNVTESLTDSTYVDDYTTGEDTVEEAKETVSASSEIMHEAGMELRKWQSNVPEVLQNVNESTATVVNSDRKVLGANWNPEKDVIYFVPKIPKLTNPTYVSKRLIISSIAKLHDPLGLISPITFKGKMMIQQLWVAGFEWDENIRNTPIAEEWIKWCEDLKELVEIQVDRKYVPEKTVVQNQELHIFNDASEKGYATVAYLRTVDDTGKVHISLVTSKTKIAPLKVITLPRLELMAAVIGSRLSMKIKHALKDESLKVICWSDSTIFLHWIKNTEVRYKPFVENRVQEARENTDPVQWRHCPGSDNPADIASRGSTAASLKNSKLWWGAPPWLKEDEDQWPKRLNSLTTNEDAMKEKRMKQPTCLVVDTKQKPLIDPLKYSHLCTLLRKIAYVLRFVNNFHKKVENKNLTLNKFPTALELQEAKFYCLKLVQREYYPEEIGRLKAGKSLNRNSKIMQLTPYIDENTGLIRMRGRIQNADLTEQEKHPIILPHKSHVVKLLVQDVHLRQLHAGVNQTLLALRNDYWVTSARSLVKTVVKTCLLCRMYMPRRLTVPFSPLPADRLKAATPFDIIGVDFTGPIHIEETKMLSAQLRNVQSK